MPLGFVCNKPLSLLSNIRNQSLKTDVRLSILHTGVPLEDLSMRLDRPLYVSVFFLWRRAASFTVAMLSRRALHCGHDAATKTPCAVRAWFPFKVPHLLLSGKVSDESSLFSCPSPKPPSGNADPNKRTEQARGGPSFMVPRKKEAVPPPPHTLSPLPHG